MHKLRSLPAVMLGLAVLAGTLLTATPASAFTGLSHDKTPSDANIAVGPNHIVEVVNSQIGFWSKANPSTPISTESIQAFLGTAPGTNNCGDPIVLYLPANQRWAFSCTEGEDSANPGVSLAVSQTADPTGAWYLWPTQTRTGIPFLDGPKLLATSDKLAIYGGGSGGDQVYVYPLATVLSGTLPAPVLRTPASSFAHKAAVFQNAASVQADGYFVGNGCTALGCGFDLLRLSGPPASPTLTPGFLGADASPALPAAQPAIPGGTIDAHLFGKDVIAAVEENRTTDGHTVIAFSGQSGCPSDGTKWCTYRDLYDLTAGQLTQGTSGQPASSNQVLGSVGLDAAGNLFNAYVFSNAGTDPSAGAAGPSWFATIAAATGTSGSTNERLGDYHDVVQDPSDGSRVWFVAGYQIGADDGQWSTAFGCGTAAGFGCSGGPPPAGPKPQYENLDTNPNDNSIKPGLQLVNDTGAPVTLSTVTVRYWFTRDGGASTFSTWCDFAQIGCGSLTESVVNLGTPRSGADAYLQVGFTAGAGQLAAGASTGQMQLRFNKTDWSAFNQLNDYSWATNTTFADTTKVTVYVNGQLVRGTEP